MKYRVLMVVVFVFFSFSFAFSQKQVRKKIRKGNKVYKQEKYIESEIYYRKALESNAHSVDAAYNLGNALYKQGKKKEALREYQIVVENEKEKKRLSMAWHNKGNVYMNSKEYQKSIEAYKNALRKNPKDEKTRYNLALAQRLLQKQQSQPNQSKKLNQDQFDRDNKNRQKRNQKQNQEKKSQGQPNSQELGKGNVEQILDAFIQNEKNTQEKIRKAQMKQTKQKVVEKNW